jgi:mercuric ion binding protein
MKSITKFLLLLLGLTFAACNSSGFDPSVTANSNVTFKIWGNCEMCKETIEGSLKVEGIKAADWNKNTKMMTVAFDSTKITLDQIGKNIAAVGYDTEKYRGDDKAYAGLPECCQYQRKD